MADKDNIDKALPNVDPEVVLPKEEIVVTEEDKLSEVTPDGAEVIMDEEGGAEVNFDPMAQQQMTQNHSENLAELLPDAVLGSIGSELNENYMQYKTSRKDWEDTYIKGLDLLGFKYVNPTQPFQGASGATHPVLAEAVTQFQAQAYKELLPAMGPVRTQTLGTPSRQKEEQSIRVKNFMNYQLMDVMKEYEPEFDQMLFYLPLAGSAFKKVYYDELLGRAVSKFVQADDLIVPYTATSLADAEAVIHVIKMSENDLRKKQVAGFYRDIEVKPGYDQETEVEKKERQLEGVKKTRDEDIFTILECHVNLDIEGFEDMKEGESTGIKLPYIVTIEEGSRQVLSIRRNYKQEDPMKLKIQYFVHFRFLPGMGFYGFGLIHMIGGLSRTATTALRQLLDAGTLSNLPAGFKQRGIRVRDEAQAIQPGEFRDVDAPGGNIKDAFMTLPFKEPSQTLLSLMGIVVQAGQRFAAIADMQVGDGNQQAAVGTTIALLERGSRVMSAIHKRLFVGLKQEFNLLAGVFKTYLPPEYPYDVVGAQRNVKVTDFDDKVDIVPVADPNIFSQSQRISMAQTELQLAQANPQMHNMYEAFYAMYSAIGVKEIDKIYPEVEKDLIEFKLDDLEKRDEKKTKPDKNQKIFDIIKKGEGQKIEFKATLQQSINNPEIPNHVIENMVIKSIVGFCNTEGGSLLIGINDDKKCIGIEADAFQNTDKFKNHLKNILGGRVEQDVFSFIKTEFFIIEGKTICLIECGKSDTALFVQYEGVTHFYKRNLESTDSLNPQETLEYCKKRFK